MSEFTLLLLGPPRIELSERTTKIPSRKAIALLAYLAVEGRAFSREYLASLLWPSLEQGRALANLRQALSLLRSTFGNECFIANGDQIQLDQASIYLDLDEFHRLSLSQSPEPGFARLVAASEIYRGRFMEGFNLGTCEGFDEWQDMVRERLRLEIDTLFETLARGYLQTDQPEQALPYAQKWLELDQLNEAAHRILMEIHGRTGRKDLVRKQLQSCIQILAREGIEADHLTRELHDAILQNSTEETLARERHLSTNKKPERSRWLRWGIGLAIVVSVILAVFQLGNGLLVWIFGSDLSVTALELMQSENELSAIQIVFNNEGAPRRNVEYAVKFVSKLSEDPAFEYEAYIGAIKFGLNAEVSVKIRCMPDIQQFVESNDVRIPPGDYSLFVVIDPGEAIIEESEFNNRLASSEQFTYIGTVEGQTIEVDIEYSGQGFLDDFNPLKVFIGDRAQLRGIDVWGQFRVITEGIYYFPLDNILIGDADDSEYFLLVIHDPGDDMRPPYQLDPGVMAGLYKEGTDNVVYGAFSVAGGTPVFPGGKYRMNFAPPPLPSADVYETDDIDAAGTLINYIDLPVRQHHTFHDKGGGDFDQDWFRILIKAGDSIVVETFSAEGQWESDTWIDCKSVTDYIGGNNDKSLHDHYSRMKYVNSTESDQVIDFLVKPQGKYGISPNWYGEYIVEFHGDAK
jgi:DNA-binding SARP family transcriptional activator